MGVDASGLDRPVNQHNVKNVGSSRQIRKAEAASMRPFAMKLLEIGANEVDQVFGQFGSNLLLGSVGQMESNVRLEHLGHQAVHASAHRGQQHQLVPAIVVGRQSSLYGIQLTTKFAHALQQLDGFPLLM